MPTIEERITQLSLNNSNFEKHAAQSINTLDKLDSSLRMTGTRTGLENMERVLEQVSHRFSALGIVGDQVIRTLTNHVTNLIGEMGSLVKSMSTDQITAGWTKYEEKTASVQTIMNATGSSIDQVNEYLSDLMWFSDETSFGFTDMTSALGQMASTGGKVEKLIPLLMGIGNAVAYAGKGASEFSRTIYNLNQSYGQGFLGYQDWRSLELAGVASEQLKQVFIDTGVALGKIKEGEVTVGNFATTLKDKWADVEVMEKAFGYFAEMSIKAKELIDSGQFDLASEAYDHLADQYDTIQVKAAKSAQEAKSFQEVISATKDAVSSGWLQSFEIIFGNYEEAKVFWTDLANEFYEIFAEPSEGRNTMLEAMFGDQSTGGWNNFKNQLDLTGRSLTDLENSMQTVASGKGIDLNSIISQYGSLEWALRSGAIGSDLFKEALINLSSGMGETVTEAVDLDTKIAELISIGEGVLEGKYGNGEERRRRLEELGYDYDLIQGIANKLYNGIPITEELIKQISPEAYSNLVSNIAKAAGFTEEEIAAMNTLLEDTGALYDDIYNDVGKKSGREMMTESIINALDALQEILGTVNSAFESVFGTAEERGKRFYEFVENIHKMSENIGLSEDSLKKLEIILVKIFSAFKKLGNIGGTGLKIAFGLIGDILDKVKTNGNVAELIKLILGYLDEGIDLVSNFVNRIAGVEETAGIFETLAGIISTSSEWISTGLSKIKTAFSDTFSGNELFGTNVVKTVGALLAAFLGFEKIKNIDFRKGLFRTLWFGLGDISKTVNDFIDSISEMFEKVGDAFGGLKNRINADAIKQLAIGIALFSASLALLAMIDSSKLGTALFVITGGLAEMILVLALLSNIKFGIGVTTKLIAVAAAMLAFSVSMIAVAGALMVMSVAVKVLSSISSDDMWRGIAGIVVALGAITAALLLLSNFASGTRLVAAGISIIALSAALLILTVAIVALSFISKDNLTKALETLGVTLILVVAAVASLGLVSLKAIAGAGALVLLSAGIVVLAVALMMLSMIPAENMTNGLLGLCAALIVMVGTLAVLSAVGPMSLVAAAALGVLSVAMVLAAGSLVVLAVALNMISPVKDDILTIAGGLAVLGAAMLVLGVGGVAAGLGIVGAASLIAFSFALNMLSGIDIGRIAGGLALLGPALIPLGLGGLVLGLGAAGLLIGAPGLAALGLALPTLSTGLQSLDNVSWGSIVKAFAVLIESIAGLLALEIAGLWNGSKQLANLGTALPVLSEGLHSLDGLSWVTIGKAFATIATGVAGLLALNLSKVNGFYTFANGFNTFVSAINNIPEDAKSKVDGVSSAINDCIKPTSEATQLLLDGMIQVFTNNISVFTDIMQQINTSMLTVIANNNQNYANAATNIINTMAISMNNGTGNFDTIGWNISVGLANGMNRGAYVPINAATNIANNIASAIQSALDIQSPSRVMEMLGMFISRGLGLGIQNGESDITDGMIVAISPALAILSMLKDESIDFTPTIRPVVDGSNIGALKSQIQSLNMSSTLKDFGRIGDMNIDGASINYSLQNRDILDEVRILGERLDSLGDAITNMQVVLDSGELVGATSAKMDNKLGQMAMRKGRGN